MPLIYLTHPRQWTVYDLWSDASDAQAIVVDVPESLIARWQTVKNEFSAVQRMLHDMYHDALSQRPTRAPKPTDAPADSSRSRDGPSEDSSHSNRDVGSDDLHGYPCSRGSSRGV